MKEVSKIALGTVQFGIPYGINNRNGVPLDQEIREIFSYAAQSGIDILETASGYGNSEKKIGELSVNKFKVVTKFPKVLSAVELKKSLENSLINLKIRTVYGYIAHNSDNLIECPDLWNVLLEKKHEKVIKKIGYSLYFPEQLEQLLDLNFLPDLVQFPYSILDKKFEKFLPLLRQLGAEVHIRSVFLQGLYFMDLSNLPKKLQPLKPELLKVQEICKMFEIPIASLALNFAIQNDNIDKVLIGVDNVLQLKENIRLSIDPNYIRVISEKINEIQVTYPHLLNPAAW